MKFFTFILEVLIIYGCANSKSSKTELADEVILGKLGNTEYEATFNADSTHAIYYAVDSSNFRSKVKFIVYSVKANTFSEVVDIVNGKVGWHNDKTIKVTEYTGIPKGEGSNLKVYYMDAVTGEKFDPTKSPE